MPIKDQLDSQEPAERIHRRKLSDQVFDRLRNMIASGELAPGDYMPSERTLMERFGVGRPAVRESLQSLHTMGLITISHGERSRVNELSAGTAFKQVDAIAQLLLTSEPANIEHLKEARRLLEAGIVKSAAERSTKKDIRDLRDLIAKQRDKLGDSEAFMQADIAFHKRIAETGRNPLLTAVSEAMLKWLFQYHTVLLHWSGREETTLAEHSEIVDLIEKRDVEGAVKAMEIHLNRSEERYKQQR
ncbi:transcriptional regulator NanR [Sneathiella chungangensis]|uniref:Transcriptional regulator NanR n=1 Tax=Sneathiella chungangensis TaxID=1418234 RepID=A0A845MCW3_9PROT|nr:transcriptional regulator NanR [Sneathiella chungangensis]MZR21146.1 transcriptional regulator NanR [Sneathiella chungangensis]